LLALPSTPKFSADDKWDFEELDDDFCLAADWEGMVPDDENDDDDEEEGGGFDFERHVRMLMERARVREGSGGDDDGARGRPDNDFFDGVVPLRGRMEEEDEDEDDFDYDRYEEEEEEEDDDDDDDDEDEGRRDEDGLDRDRDGERQRVLCRKFEEALLEYDSDEMGDDDDHFGGESDTYLSVNRGEARHKDETKEEKRGRKMAVKEERKICRMQKKIMKEAFAEEFQKRGQDTAVDPVGGNKVFRFS